MAIKYWRGGGYTLRASGGTVADDGSITYDDAGGFVKSNWVDATGTGVAKPANGDDLRFTGFASRIPDTYSEAAEPHIPGKHFMPCHDLDLDAFDLLNIFFTKDYTGDCYEWLSNPLQATAVVTDGGNAKFTIDDHGFAVGDIVTIVGTVYYNGEWRIITTATAHVFTIDTPFTVGEVPSTSGSAVARKPLRFACTGKVVVESDTLIYLECSDNGVGGDNVPQIVFKSNTGLLKLSSDGITGGGADGEWDEILVLKNGTLRVFKNGYVDKIIISGDALNHTMLVGLDVQDVGSNAVDLEIETGIVTWNSKLGQVTLSGGKITHCQNVLLGASVDIDNILGRGGNIDTYMGSLKAFTMYSGNIVMLGDADRVVGSGAVSYSQYGGVIDLSQASGMITRFAGSDVDRQGGDLKLPLRTNVTW